MIRTERLLLRELHFWFLPGRYGFRSMDTR